MKYKLTSCHDTHLWNPHLGGVIDRTKKYVLEADESPLAVATSPKLAIGGGAAKLKEYEAYEGQE